jgi:polysaccharide biosynthesis protein PslH
VNADLKPYRGAVYVVADHPWPVTSGGRARDAARATALQSFGPVTVLALDTPDPPAAWAAGLRRYWARRRRQPVRLLDLGLGILGGNHVALQRAEASGLPAALKTVIRDLRPSLVVLGRPFFGTFVQAAREAGACVIVDADESLDSVSRSVLGSRASIGKRARALVDLASVGRMERRDFPQADEVWAGSEAERGTLQAAAAPTFVRVVPNIAPRAASTLSTPPKLSQIAFLGSFSHPPNEEAAIELATRIMPAIRAVGGPQELVLIGRDPSRHVIRVASRDPAITLAGNVPDVSVPLRAAGVLVMPMRSGGGSKIKALEAAALGVPVISTAFGLQGVRLQPENDVLVAETPADFARAVLRLRDDVGLAERLVANARERLATHHSPEALIASISSAVAACSGHPRGASRNH